MPREGNSAQDEPNESEHRIDSIGVGHLERGFACVGVLNNWLAVEGSKNDGDEFNWQV
jgi:hypothetical protein